MCPLMQIQAFIFLHLLKSDAPALEQNEGSCGIKKTLFGQPSTSHLTTSHHKYDCFEVIPQVVFGLNAFFIWSPLFIYPSFICLAQQHFASFQTFTHPHQILILWWYCKSVNVFGAHCLPDLNSLCSSQTAAFTSVLGLPLAQRNI